MPSKKIKIKFILCTDAFSRNSFPSPLPAPQFTDFLVAGSKSIEPIVALMPPLSALLGQVGLAVPVALELVRPIMRAALQFGPSAEQCPEHLRPWHPFSAAMTECVAAHLQADSSRAEVARFLSPSLFLLFWSLSLYDVHVPERLYADELKRLSDRRLELENQVRPLPAVGHPEARAKRSEIAKLSAVIKEMSDERAEQSKNFEQVQALMLQHKEAFFAHVAPRDRQRINDFVMQVRRRFIFNMRIRILFCFAASLSAFFWDAELKIEEKKSSGNKYFYFPRSYTSLISNPPPRQLKKYPPPRPSQHLVLPRLLMGPIDAVYCVRFGLILHRLDTPHFSTLQFADKLCRGVAPLIYCSTEAEASFAGHAVNDMLAVTNAWLDSKETYLQDAASRVGCSDLDAGPSPQPIDHETFSVWAKGLHAKLTAILLAALGSKEYIEIRCALIFLSKVVTNFPSRVRGGKEIQDCVAAIEARETARVDLQLMARSLGGAGGMKKASLTWIGPSGKRLVPPVKKATLPPEGQAASGDKFGDKHAGGPKGAGMGSMGGMRPSASTASMGPGDRRYPEGSEGGRDRRPSEGNLQNPSAGAKRKLDEAKDGSGKGAREWDRDKVTQADRDRDRERDRERSAQGRGGGPAPPLGPVSGAKRGRDDQDKSGELRFLLFFIYLSPNARSSYFILLYRKCLPLLIFF